MPSIIIEKDGFNQVMQSLKPFVAVYESRETLRHIKLEHKAGSDSVTAVALDGFKLCKLSIPCSGEDDFDAIIPVVQKTSAKSVRIIVEGDRITFDHEGLFTITYKKIGGEYINWRKIIPSENKQYAICVNPRYLADALKSVPKNTKSVILRFGSRVSPILVEDGEGLQMLVLPIRNSRFEEEADHANP